MNKRISVANVRRLAEERGIGSPNELAEAATINSNTARRWWLDDTTITRLESMLEGAPTVETQKVLEKFCSQQDIEIQGVDLQDWIKVLST